MEKQLKKEAEELIKRYNKLSLGCSISDWQTWETQTKNLLKKIIGDDKA